MDQRFLPQERLKSKQRIAEIFSQGSSRKFYPFVLWYLPARASHSRVAISVPKRRIATAVKRNLIKRRAREAYRLQKGKYAGSESSVPCDMVWVYIAREPMAYNAIQKAVHKGLDYLATALPLQ